MEWQSWCKELVEVLGLEKTPVAVTYTDRLPPEAQTPKCRVCSGLYQAAAGQMLGFEAANSACPGGSMYLGFRTQTPEQAVKLRNFLINGEKLFSCPAAIFRSQATGPRLPLGLAQHVLFAPLSQAPLQPDVVVFLCNAAQAARLVNLAYFETGEALQCDPTGALCRAAITYPLVTNRVNVTFGDVTARKSEQVADDELYVTLPWIHLRSLMASLDRCSAGQAPSDLSQVPTSE